ncbi:MAG: response regulator transcription factor [Cyclobacteriaceae bacterium]|nr:response regulator transcription factor [Cyclobacteriaceae bacterium]
MKNTKKIFLVDDHQMFLDGLESLLNDVKTITIVGKASNGKEALELIDKSVDVVLMDISMPEIDGIEFNRLIKLKYPDINTIAISMHNDAKILDKLIRGNINGYLLKNAEKNELLEAINTVSDGDNYFSEEVKRTYQDSLFKRENTQDQAPQLSKRELEVLGEIINELTTKEIAEKLFISQHTVESHRKNMLSKLGARNTAGLVKYALENRLSN